MLLSLLLMWNGSRRYSMGRVFRKSTILLGLSMLLAWVICACGRVEKAECKVAICDFTAFSTNASDENEQMDELYLYICTHSQVENLPGDMAEKLADNIEAFYVKLVEEEVADYNSKGNNASFEEMLYFLFHLDSREALRFFAEGFAKNEMKNRLVIQALAEAEGVTVATDEYESEKDSVEVSSFMVGDAETEIRYELLRRKVLKAILYKIK